VPQLIIEGPANETGEDRGSLPRLHNRNQRESLASSRLLSNGSTELKKKELSNQPSGMLPKSNASILYDMYREQVHSVTTRSELEPQHTVAAAGDSEDRLTN
jgi:hypothetical protein